MHGGNFMEEFVVIINNAHALEMVNVKDKMKGEAY